MAGFIDSLRRVLGGSGEPDPRGDAMPDGAAKLDFERRSATAPPRQTAPTATIEIDGHTATTVDWSIAGLLAKAPDFTPAIGSTVEGTVTVAAATGPFTARVVRQDAVTGTFAIAFIRL